MATSFSAANGITYNGQTIGSGYDCRLVVTGRSVDGDTLVVGCITHLATKREWLLDLRYPDGADLQLAAVLLAQNPPYDEPELMVPEDDEDRWEPLARRWDVAIDDDLDDDAELDDLRAEDMVAVIEAAGEQVTGGEDATTVARAWIAAELSPESASAYIAAGCWDADRVAELVAADISAEQIADHAVLRAVAAQREWQARERGRATSGSGDDLVIADWVTDGSLGYAHSNGDISTAAIMAAIEEVRS